jgi:alkanesulfonate monooxygenase SsuD/methylene tetrahydromethanopterin reductase-like flavin-dependent oxidoreductase (luciferase family)
VELIKALWTESKVSYQGNIFQLDGATMALKPVQKPHPPIWFGGRHPDALRRAATTSDGWMGSGTRHGRFCPRRTILKAELEKARRDPATFPISKRVFLSVHERADVARAELNHWFDSVYHDPERADASGIHGTPVQVRARIEELVEMGANHLLLNPVCRYAEQVETLAEVVGLHGRGN